MPARFYLAEDVPFALMGELQRLGHNVVHVRNMGTTGRTDGYHLRTARAEARTMVIHNGNDYHLIHDALHRWLTVPRELSAPQIHSGILHIPQKFRLKAQELAQAIEYFLLSGLLIQDRYYSYDPQKNWVETPFNP